MGILNALSTAVTGISAQSYALENISGNIANSQTIGYKRVDTSFVDLIPDSPQNHESAGTVVSYSKLTNTLQGTLQSTGINTNMAINGDGYFTVSENTGSTTLPTFTGTNLYTRRGDFRQDANGYLVNGSGKYLVGTLPGSSVMSPIKLPSTPIAAKQTTAITYEANVPSYPKTANADTTVADSELIHPASYATDPRVGGSGTIVGGDATTFLKESVPGGEITVYDTAGAPLTLKLRWAKTDTSATGGTDTWNAFYEAKSNPAAADVAWQNLGANITFTPSGTLTSASTITIPALTINGTTFGSVSLDFGSGGLTQYSDVNGGVSTGNVTQDGYATGSLEAISVSSDGRVSGSFSNGQVQTLSQISIAHFRANDALKRMDGGTYAETLDSGAAVYGLKGSSLTGGSVEMSNTDISEEFSKMIVTQQAYSANTRVMSTAQQMLQDVINIIR